MVMQPSPQQRGASSRRRVRGRASGERYNRIVDVMVDRYRYWVDYFVELMTEDGYPPFMEPAEPRQQYEKLIAWRAAGDPRYWQDAEAQAALAELSAQYGPPPPLTPFPQPRQF